MTLATKNIEVEDTLFNRQIARGQQIITSATGTYQLDNTAPLVNIFEGTALGQIVKLPAANTLTYIGWEIQVYNSTSENIIIQDFDGNELTVLAKNGKGIYHLKRDTTTAGEWEVTANSASSFQGTSPVLFQYAAQANTGRVLEYVPSLNSEEAPFVAPNNSIIIATVLSATAAVNGDKTVGIFENSDLINPIHTITILNGTSETVELGLNIAVNQLGRISVRVLNGPIAKPYLTFYINSV